MRALYLNDCLGLEKPDRYFYEDTEFQQLQKIQASGGLNPVQQTRFNQLAGQQGPDSSQLAQQAQQQYQSGINTAVSTLQSAGTSLADQYKTLLGNVMNQGTVAMNTATTGENNLLGQRGITNNSPLYSQQMTLAQLPVTAQNQAAVSNLGFTEGQLQNTLAQNVAGIQSNAAQFSAGLPLSYGSLALAQAANVANIGLAQAQTAQTGVQTKYIQTPYGLYDTNSRQFVTGNGTLPSGGQVVYQNGQYYLNVP